MAHGNCINSTSSKVTNPFSKTLPETMQYTTIIFSVHRLSLELNKAMFLDIIRASLLQNGIQSNVCTKVFVQKIE